MARDKLNRWGEPEETEPTLHIDEWFPSEKTYRSESTELLSRAFVPIGIMLGLLLASVSGALVSFAFRGEQFNSVAALVGGGVGAWSLFFLVPYGTLVYYGIKKQVLLSRRDRGLPVDIVPEDIDEYAVPLRTVPGVARLIMGELSSGNKATPLGMRRARVLTIALAASYFVVTVVLVLVNR
jgi:hypothetical protein